MKFTLIMINLTYLFCIYESSTLRQLQGTTAKHQPQHIRLSSKGNPPVKQNQLRSKSLNDQSKNIFYLVSDILSITLLLIIYSFGTWLLRTDTCLRSFIYKNAFH